MGNRNDAAITVTSNDRVCWASRRSTCSDHRFHLGLGHPTTRSYAQRTVLLAADLCPFQISGAPWMGFSPMYAVNRFGLYQTSPSCSAGQRLSPHRVGIITFTKGP